MSEKHVPVLLNDVLKLLPEDVRSGWDVTFGRGGHTMAILQKYPKCQILGVDRDLAAIDFGKSNYTVPIEEGKLQLLHGNFHEIEDWAAEAREKIEPQFILADLGVSSPQLDQPERGFSFYNDGPLDMRMDTSKGITAADIVNEWSEAELSELFQELGEVRSPFRVVKAIVADREETPFTRTLPLADMIGRIEGWRKKGHHPATKYFLALRMQVNDEISKLKSSILSMIKALSPEGRLLVITFHSLEDRIVKWTMKDSEMGKLVNKKVIQATWNEKQQNPRARSAKLRVFERM